VGEAGLGKSRLLREFQRWLQVVPYRGSIFCGRAEAETSSLPFSLLRDVFRSRFEILESDSASVAWEKFSHGFEDLIGNRVESPQLQAQKLSQLLGFDFSSEASSKALTGNSEQTRHELFRSLSELFLFLNSPRKGADGAGESPRRAAVLVLEDLH